MNFFRVAVYTKFIPTSSEVLLHPTKYGDTCLPGDNSSLAMASP